MRGKGGHNTALRVLLLDERSFGGCLYVFCHVYAHRSFTYLIPCVESTGQDVDGLLFPGNGDGSRCEFPSMTASVS